jgi:hypothetical protein
MNSKSLLKKVLLFAFVLVFTAILSFSPTLPLVQAASPAPAPEPAPAPAPAPMLAAAPEKAIYVLPGYMGSRLFSQKNPGTDIWVGQGLFTDVNTFAKDSRSELANDSSGVGMTAYADRNKDKAGLMAAYLPLVSSIKLCLSNNGLSKTYNVEFFSYNWLQDLNTTAQELADDIKAKGYESVIFVTHSNGGLVASAFIAQSAANKNMVEKAIFLASPLWGTYSSLETLETGTLGGNPISALLSLGYDIFRKPVSKNWVKAWARNSPNTHQLIAGNEYIGNIPIFYKTSWETQGISDAAAYYALLKKSTNINALLVDGNARSLRYLRDTVYKGDVLALWDGLDVTMVGCDYGFMTPYSVVYRQSGEAAVYDGTLYSKAGDWLVSDISMKSDGRFPFISLPGAQHLQIMADPRALRVVNDLIQDKPVSNYTSFESIYPKTSSILPSVGMSDMLRIEIKSSDPLETSLRNTGIHTMIFDKKGRLAAHASGEAQLGYTENNFTYNAWSTAEYATNILCYFPLNDYSMEVFTGNIIRSSSDITVFVETLDPSGAILSRDEYKFKGANMLTGSIFTLEGSKSLKPTAKSGATLTVLSNATFRQNWQFSTTELPLKQGAAAQPAISGPDAPLMMMGNYNWSSSNPYVATVSPTGLITALAPGTAVITATARDESFKMASIKVIVGF